MNNSPEVQSALSRAWHQDAAESSLERWLDLSKQEGWNIPDDALVLMTLLFGASWYFTRFVFFRGANVIHLFDKQKQDTPVIEAALSELKLYSPDIPLDDAIEQLRIRKNEIMLSILLLQLEGLIDQEQAESLLTRLAENVLTVMYRLFGLEDVKNAQCLVLAMGRFAGGEMTYGSDLDLIFIEKVLDESNFEQTVNKIRKMLRYIAVMDPSGALYQIDMRLRPHGSSGVLVTALDSFLDFHDSEREIWERQMLTRCRIVIGDSVLSEKVGKKIQDNLYGKYEVSFLAKEIMKIRFLVEQELAGGKDKIDLKRGKGGIMDIDFLTHFLQLAYGAEHDGLKTASTRQVLRSAANLGLLNKKTATSLLKAYDFYKLSESALRVFDMKSTSKVAVTTKTLLPLARAAGYLAPDIEVEVDDYLDKLKRLRSHVREQFEHLLHEAY